MAIRERIRKLWAREQRYEPVGNGSNQEGDDSTTTTSQPAFSYVEYAIFLLLGVSMLWAWNMFLAAGPYFQYRFRSNPWIIENFQAAEISVSTVVNTITVLVLTRIQVKASYPKRIASSLVINIITFTFLAASTSLVLNASAEAYFGFLMVTILSSSLATGLCQNGIFAYVSGFGEPAYTQAIMTGQAVAGVLPCIAQIVSVLSLQGEKGSLHDPKGDNTASPAEGSPAVAPSAALAYFSTATVIATSTVIAFFYLLAKTRQQAKLEDTTTPDLTEHINERKAIPMHVLFKKLSWIASAVFFTFAVTMIFPVFTQRIVSVRPLDEQPPILQAPCFIPLAFLFWNSGDLIGRLLTAVPSLSLVQRPRVVLALSVSRLAFIGLYSLCNIRGRGAIIESDLFYLIVVQLCFGLSNGYLGSTCMIGAPEYVDPEEREQAGGFMSLCLVIGLTVGSLASFFVAGT